MRHQQQTAFENIVGKGEIACIKQFLLFPQCSLFNPFPNDKFYTLQNSEFSDDNFKFDENGRKLSKRVENTVGKG